MKLHKIFSSGRIGDSLALIAGALLTLAFAPYHLFLIGILSPALLLGLWLYVSEKRAFYRGFIFGVGFFSTGVYWIFNSIHTFGHASIFFSALITVGLILILSIFPAMHGFLLNRYFPSRNWRKVLCAFPAIWVFMEWVRSFISTGFPWLLLGYSQTDTFLKGYAPIFSVYGLSLATVLSSALLVEMVLRRRQQKIIFYCFLAIAFIWGTGACLSQISWTTPQGQPIQVSLVQGNIAQETKWSPEQVQPTLDQYTALSEPHWDSQIIVWPEGAIPLTLQDAENFIEGIASHAQQNHTTFITGIPMKAVLAGGYYNAVIARGEGSGNYLKRRLVPFGEFMPVPDFLRQWLGKFVEVPMSDFVSGPSNAELLNANGIKIAAFVCYEIAYPELVLNRDPDIGMILTVSNDAWFGHSIAQAQHLQIATLRALESGRPVLFVANSGITAIINPQGKIQSEIPPYESAVLTDKVQAMQGETPWQRFALDPLLLILIALIAAAKIYK